MGMRERYKVPVLIAVVCVCGVAAAITASTNAFGSGTGPHAVAGAPGSPTGAELAAIQQLVLTAAKADGDASPTDASLVPSTRQVAEQVAAGSGTGYADTPVYFVAVDGHFTVAGVSPYPSAVAGTIGGTVLTLTIDPATNTITDAGVGNTTPDLNAIGVPQPLPLPTPGG